MGISVHTYNSYETLAMHILSQTTRCGEITHHCPCTACERAGSQLHHCLSFYSLFPFGLYRPIHRTRSHGPKAPLLLHRGSLAEQTLCQAVVRSGQSALLGNEKGA